MFGRTAVERNSRILSENNFGGNETIIFFCHNYEAVLYERDREGYGEGKDGIGDL